MGNNCAIHIGKINKSFGSRHVLHDVSFDVHYGEIFGLLGPNGAGKSTTIEIIEGFKQADSGTIEVLGHDVRTRVRKLRGKIGLMMQDTALYQYLTVYETLSFFASLYEKPMPIEELINILSLNDSRKVQVRRLSGGQKRKLDMGVAMVGNPELLILDEPTTGFDPLSRRDTWDTITSFRDRGKTIVITTQMMDEAEYLCDKVALLLDGQVALTGLVEDVKTQYRMKLGDDPTSGSVSLEDVFMNLVRGTGAPKC